MVSDNYYRDVEKAKENLKDNDQILEENKEKLLEFDRELELNDYSEARRYKYLTHIPKLVSELDVPFEEAEREDIEDLIIKLKRRDDINERTKNDYKTLLKRLYKWIGDGEYPDCVDWLKINYNAGNGKLPEEMLVEEDVEELIRNAMNTRDKAMISLLWETGARIGELIDLTIGSIEDHKHGLKIVVDGKTGSRRLPLIESVPYLKQWLNEHPDRENKEAPLWVNIGQVNKDEPMAYRSIRKMLNDVKNRSEVDKPVNPHNFRHSRATYMATRFTEAQLCEWFGWVQGSDVPSKYTHLSGRDIDNDYARLHGIEEEKDHKKAKLIPNDCPRCGEKVPKDDRFCHRCGQALTVDATEMLDSGEEELDKKFSEGEETIGELFMEYIDQKEGLKEEFKEYLEKQKFQEALEKAQEED